MTRRADRVTQTDLTRLAKAIAAAGGRVAAEIGKDGTIRLVAIDAEKNSGEKLPVAVELQGEPVL